MMNDNERFSKIAGNTYENKINDLYIIIKEKQKNNDAKGERSADTTNDINNLVEVMAEYKEYKQRNISRVKQIIIERVKNKYNNIINKEITERFKQLKEDNKEDYETDIDDYDYYYIDDDIINNTNDY
jgi:hypothetical protein